MTRTRAKNNHLTERSYGVFYRAFQLPVGIDPASVEATMSNGVLKIKIPKHAHAEAKKIEVKVASALLRRKVPADGKSHNLPRRGCQWRFSKLAGAARDFGSGAKHRKKLTIVMASLNSLPMLETLQQPRMPRQRRSRDTAAAINVRVLLAAFVPTYRTDRRGGYDEIRSKQDDVAIHSASHRDSLYHATNV
jgi:hypothetical protein